MTDQTPRHSSANLFPVIKQTHRSQLDTATKKYIYPYLLFEGLPGAGTDFLGIVDRLPCRTRDNVVGEAE